MAKKYSPPVFTGLSGDEIIAQRKTQSGVLTGDQIIAQRKGVTTTTPQTSVTKKQKLPMSVQDFYNVIQKQEKTKNKTASSVRGGEIKEYKPTFAQRIKDFGRNMNTRIKGLASGLSKESNITDRERTPQKMTASTPTDKEQRFYKGAMGEHGFINTPEGLVSGDKIRSLSEHNLVSTPEGLINGDEVKKRGGFGSAIASNMLQGLKDVGRGVTSAYLTNQAKFNNRTADFSSDERLREFKGEQANRQLDAVQKIYERSAQERQALQEKYNHLPGWQQVTAELVGTVGQVLPIAVSGLASPTIAQLALYEMAAGHGAGEALIKGADLETAIKAGRATGIMEVAIERLFGGIPGLGKGLITGPKEMVEKFITSPVGRAAVNRVGAAVGEGAEEIVAELVEPFIKRYYYDPDAPMPTTEELLMAFGGGGVASLILGIPVDVFDVLEQRGQERSTAKEQQFLNAVQQAELAQQAAPAAEAIAAVPPIQTETVPPIQTETVLPENIQPEPVQVVQTEGQPQTEPIKNIETVRTTPADPEAAFVAAAEGKNVNVPEFAQAPEAGDAIIKQRKAEAIKTEEIKPTEEELQVTEKQEESVQNEPDHGYKGQHQAPLSDNDVASPAHNVTLNGTFPDNFYTDNQAHKKYGAINDEIINRKTMEILKSIKDNPEANITIYRAVPKKFENAGINRGDWATINRDYAELHGKSQLKGDYVILEKPVKAKELFNDGDSIHEWGYDPVEETKAEPPANSSKEEKEVNAEQSKPQKPKTPLEQLKHDLKEHGISTTERQNVIDFYKKHIEGAKNAGLNVEHVVRFTKQFSDEVTENMLRSHGLEKGTDAYVAGKAMLEKNGAVLKTSVELLADPSKPITQELIHEYAELWVMLWGLTDKRGLKRAINFLVEKGIDDTRAREHLPEIFTDYVLSHKDFKSESKTFFGKMIKKFKDWVEGIVERLTYFRKNVRSKLSKEIKEQAEAFAKGDWEKAFRKLRTGWTPSIMAYSVKKSDGTGKKAFKEALERSYKQWGKQRYFDRYEFGHELQRVTQPHNKRFFRRKKPMRYLVSLWGGVAKDAGFATESDKYMASHRLVSYNERTPLRLPDENLTQRYIVNAHSPREAVKKLGLHDIKPYATRDMFGNINYQSAFSATVRNLYWDEEDPFSNTVTYGLNKNGKIRYLSRYVIGRHLPNNPEEDMDTYYEAWNYAQRRYSIKQYAPTFYSKLEKVIEEKMPNSAPAEMVKALLEKNGVKSEEMKWSGMDDILSRGSKLSKNDVLEELRLLNKIEIAETVRQDDVIIYPEEANAQIEKYTKVYAQNNEKLIELYEKHTGKFPDFPLLEDDAYFWNSVERKTRDTEDYQLVRKLTLEAEDANLKIKALRDKYEKLTKQTKYSKYALPGGKHYQELLFTLPETGDGFTSGHWDEKNVLAHVRFNEREGDNGEKVLFIEEIQSDWHQAGRKKGYKDSERELADLVNEDYRVSDAPFKKTWHEFVLKRMIRYAAENGYDLIAWTTGEQQTKRYNLQKVVDTINAYKNDDGTYDVRAYTREGEKINTASSKNFTKERILEIYGQDLGSRMIKTVNEAGEAIMSGDDLAVGSEGMKGFYDKIIPDFLNKYGKKWGAKVGGIKIGGNNQHSLPITDSMKESVLYEGQPQFAVHQGGVDPILETYKRLFPEKSIARTINKFIDDRDWDEVGNRKINAFSFDNHGIRPWIIQEAEYLMRDLMDTSPAARYPIKSEYEFFHWLPSDEWSGSPRVTSESIERIKDMSGASYAEIKDALERLIDGGGKENTALCKRIELVINDRLTYGYKTFEGYPIPPDEEYLKFKSYLAEEYYGKTGTEGRSRDTSNLTSPIGQSGIGKATGKNTTGRAKRASEIVKDFERRLNATIKKGVTSRSRLGEFENRTHLIRIAKANDLATLAHETGHYFDKLFTLTDIITLKKRLKEEAKTVEETLLSLGERTSRKSYAKYKVRREGIAEFYREYFIDKDNAAKKYPELTAYVKDYVPKDVMAIVEEIAKDVWDLANADIITRGLSQIQFKGDPLYPAPVDVTRLLRQVYTGVVDATYPVEWAAGELGGKVFRDEISNELSVLRGWEGIALADINPRGEKGYFQADLDGEKVGESYFDITKPIHKDEETRRLFWLYSVARRNEDYTKLGLDMPDSPETYIEQRRILEQQHPEFKEVFEKTRQYRSNAYDLLVQGGIYNMETKEEIEKANPNYVSLKRIKEAFDYVAGTSPRLGGAKKVVKRRTGGGEDIMDPEESDINNTFIYRNVAMRNRLLLKLVDMSELAEGKGAIITKAKDKFKATEFNLNKVKKYLYDVFESVEEVRDKYGSAKKFVDSLDLNTMVRIFDPQYLAGPNQIVVYRDGQPELYDVHPDVYEAVKGLTPETFGPIVKFLAGVSQVRRTGIIFTLQFVYRNLGRDTQHNLISSDSGIHMGNIISGFYSALKGDKWSRIMSRMGGTTNYFTANERKYAQEAIDEILSNGKRHKEFVNKLASAARLTRLGHPVQGAVEAGKSIGTVFKVIQDMIDPTEQAGRLAETKKSIIKYLKASGFTDADIKEMEAQEILNIVPERELKQDVARARNLSVDFRKMGSWVRKMQLNRLLIFFNPQVQGLANVTRLFKNHPIRTTVRGFLYITLPTLALMWLNWDNPYYHELPWWRRDLAWNIPLGNPKNTKWFFPIPKPWEFGLIFGALPERLLYEKLTKDPAAWDEFDATARDTIFPDFLGSSPIGPLYEDATGKDWRGRNILSMADQRVSPYLQYNEYTSIVAKKVAEGLKDIPGVPEFVKSPKRLQKVLEGYTGTLGGNVLDTIDQLTGNKPGIPIVSGLKRSFVVDAQQSPRSVDKFYKYKNKLETQYSDAKKLGQELPPDVSAMRKAFNATSTIVNELEDAIAAIERSDVPNKNLEMSAIRADLIQIVKAVNEAYEKVLLNK